MGTTKMAAPVRNVFSSVTLRLVKPQFKLCSRNFPTIPPVWLGGRPKKKFADGMGQLPKPEKSLAVRLEEERLQNPYLEIEEDIPDIGLEYKRQRATEVDLELRKNSRANLEQTARHKELRVPLEEVAERYATEFGPEHTRNLASHYGIYQDLFNGAVFTPVVQLNICYDYDDEFVTPVFRGNKIAPSEALTEPHVNYSAEEGSLWTLALVNPDGHLTDNDKDYCHWLVGNIPGNDVSQGDKLCQYLPPFPPRGTGYHRHAFVLFKQDAKIDYSGDLQDPEGFDLGKRTFEMLEFYRKYQDRLTPVGLAFFQADWDESVRETYHQILDMGEPAFEFNHPPPYHPRQVMYPKGQPFNRYFDRYRDKKDLAEEVMMMKLDMISPYKPFEHKQKYPLVSSAYSDVTKVPPSWMKERMKMMNMRIEQFKDLPVPPLPEQRGDVESDKEADAL